VNEAPSPDLSRAKAATLVALIALVTLGLGLWELRADLPAVLHSDFVQAKQALDLLRTGRVQDEAVYPLPLVYVYAGAFVATYAVGHVLGWGHYVDWPTFVQHVSRPEVHHAIGRAVGALCAALLAVGVYRLARVRFDRSVAVLATAAASFSPLLTIYAHQFRPHVPVIALIVLVAPAVLRAAIAPSLRTAVLSGLGGGVASATFQVGLPFAASAFALAVLLVRPGRLMARTLAGIGLGFAAGWVGLSLLATRTGLLAEGSEAGGLLMRGKGGGLGYGVNEFFGSLSRFTLVGPLWLAAEPLCALAFTAFIVMCLAKRRSWRDVILYGTPAAAILAGIGLVHMARPRYTMYATPFLAPLAASAVLAIPRVPAIGLAARRLAVALLVLVPLASSVRSDLLLSRSDTRMATHAALPGLQQSGLRVVVQADILPAVVGVPPGVSLFPPRADYRDWMTKKETPIQTLVRLKPDVFVRGHGATNVTALDLQYMGLVRAHVFGAETIFVPDDPMWLLPELWQAQQPGPQIDCMARKEAVARVRAALGP